MGKRRIAAIEKLEIIIREHNANFILILEINHKDQFRIVLSNRDNGHLRFTEYHADLADAVDELAGANP